MTYEDSPAGKRRFGNAKLYKMSFEFQEALAKEGIAWHNVFSNECTADFSCCMGDGKYYAYLPSYLTSAKQLFSEFLGGISDEDISSIEKLKKKAHIFLET